MITEINNPTETRHYLAHNGEDVFHYGILEPGQYLITGQPFVENVATEAEWMEKAIAIGLVDEKIDNIEVAPIGKVDTSIMTENIKLERVMSYQEIAVAAKKESIAKSELSNAEAKRIVAELAMTGS